MAGASSRADEGKKKARIEIIPLIDVIFFLLATFVLFTLSLDRISSLPVTLPKAVVNTTSAPDENMLSIQVSEPGTIYWRIGVLGSPELISPNEVKPRLEDYLKTYQGNAKVIVRGDNRAKFGAAVMVLDTIRQVGIQQVSVETVASPTGK
jgi:biopolymer transport protein ExbD